MKHKRSLQWIGAEPESAPVVVHCNSLAGFLAGPGRVRPHASASSPGHGSTDPGGPELAVSSAAAMPGEASGRAVRAESAERGGPTRRDHVLLLLASGTTSTLQKHPHRVQTLPVPFRYLPCTQPTPEPPAPRRAPRASAWTPLPPSAPRGHRAAFRSRRGPKHVFTYRRGNRVRAGA